jgi:serine palmitoyltransferase
VDELCEEWQPEPLTPEKEAKEVEHERVELGYVVEGVKPGKVRVVGVKEECVDMGTHNFLGYGGDERVLDACEKTIRTNGVGTCGPRGFYGTVDKHLSLEEKLQEFFGTESSIMYSYDFATITSVIPAFAKRGDYLVVDKAVNMAVQTACYLSRSKIVWFEHNSSKSLEEALQKVRSMMTPKQEKVQRKFIVVEGVYANVGDICILPEVVRLARKHKFRIFMDDTLGLGVLGKTGRGTAEHFDFKPRQIDVIMGGLGHAMASVGGFCVGSEILCDHQRLSGSGYCFSASLPSYLATAAIEAFNLLEKDESRLVALRENSKIAHAELSKYSKMMTVRGSAPSPVIHVEIVAAEAMTDAEKEDFYVGVVGDMLKQHKVVISCGRYSQVTENDAPAPSLKLCMNAAVDQATVKKAIKALGDCVSARLATANRK